MNNDHFNYLIKQYTCGEISIKDQEELFTMIVSGEFDNALILFIQENLKGGFLHEKANLPPHVSEEIIRNIFKAEKDTTKLLSIGKKRSRIRHFVAAACTLVIIATVYYYSFQQQKPDAASSFKALIPASDSVYFNTSGNAKVVALPDGSRVTLQPQSSISYPKQFLAEKREVYLQGQAFFQVTKNPQQPFLVYCNSIITKVLGTSFKINTNNISHIVEVEVKTGRVQVYENEKLVKEKDADNEVIITPNQKAIYKEEKRVFRTTLADEPVPIVNEITKADSVMSDEKPLVYEQKLYDIFQSLERRYGIEIAVENTDIYNCLFTGDLSGKDFYDILKVICLTTNASYEVNGTTVLIKGNGCK
jgi:transmembrane sensor